MKKCVFSLLFPHLSDEACWIFIRGSRLLSSPLLSSPLLSSPLLSSPLLSSPLLCSVGQASDPSRHYLNSKCEITEGTAGPQQEAPDHFGHSRTSTASVRSVQETSDLSGHSRTSTASAAEAPPLYRSATIATPAGQIEKIKRTLKSLPARFLQIPRSLLLFNHHFSHFSNAHSP